MKTQDRSLPKFAIACIVLTAAYLPYGWLLFVDAAPSYRIQWLMLWPILPGFVPCALVQLGIFSVPAGLLITGWMLYRLVTFSIRVPKACVLVIPITLLISSFFSWVAYGLFRA